MHKNQKTYFGAGSIQRIRGILARHRPAHIMMVTGKDSYKTSGAKKELDGFLKEYRVTVWNDFGINPRYEDIRRGSALLRSSCSDFMIAVGGGSVIDMGKLINHDVFLPLIAIPTTAGTGSEATHFATFYRDKIKHSCADPRLLPAYAVVDPQLTFSLPPYVTACTGMDALAQAIESYWSTHATRESRCYARRALLLARSHLRKAVAKPTTRARIAMSRAANLAGKAINISKTTACHAISYPFTSFFNIPHGHAVGLTLSSMVRYNAEYARTRIAKRAMREIIGLLGASDSTHAARLLDDLMEAIGLETRLRKLGVADDRDINLIADHVNAERLSHNPAPMSKESIKTLCKELW